MYSNLPALKQACSASSSEHIDNTQPPLLSAASLQACDTTEGTPYTQDNKEA